MPHSKTCATGHQLLGGWGRGGRGGRGRGVQGGGDTQSAGRRRRCGVTLARGEGVGVGWGWRRTCFERESSASMVVKVPVLASAAEPESSAGVEGP